MECHFLTCFSWFVHWVKFSLPGGADPRNGTSSSLTWPTLCRVPWQRYCCYSFCHPNSDLLVPESLASLHPSCATVSHASTSKMSVCFNHFCWTILVVIQHLGLPENLGLNILVCQMNEEKQYIPRRRPFGNPILLCKMSFNKGKYPLVINRGNGTSLVSGGM